MTDEAFLTSLCINQRGAISDFTNTARVLLNGEKGTCNFHELLHTVDICH